MRAEANLVADSRFNNEELCYISTVLLSLAGINTELKAEPKGESGLYLNGERLISAEELNMLFETLSLKREFTLPEDMHGRAEERFKNDLYKIPLVNRSAEKLSRSLGKEKPRGRFRIIFTHDIDWVTGKLSISILKSLKHTLTGRKAHWLKLRECFDTKIFYKGIEKVLDIEKSAGIKSWFFLLSGPFGNGRYSSRYDSRWDEAKSVIELINKNGCEIGLHGSYYAPDNNLYKEEAERLREASGNKIRSHRNHYLRFRPESLCESMEQAGMDYDFSIGYNSHIGFRAGIADKFPLYNHVKKRISPVTEIPLIFMERDWHLADEGKTFSSALRIINEVKNYNGCVSVLFHPEGFVVDNRWYKFYMKFIEMCADTGADISGNIN